MAQLMKNTRLSISIVPVVMLLASASAVAQEAVVEEEAAPPVVNVTGFVNTLAIMPLNEAAGGGIDASTFGLEQVEVDFTIAPTDDLVIQSDLNFFPASPVTRADDLVEQAFFDYSIGEGGFISAGKRNAPIGAEALDQPGRYQISLGQLFTYTTPSNITGAFGGYRNDDLMIMVWVTNNWDLPTTAKTATPGGRVQYSLDSGYVAVSGTYGPMAGEAQTALVDLDTGWTVGDLTVLGEVGFASLDDTTSLGFMVAGNYAFTDMFSATLRGDYLDRDIVGSERTASSATVAGLLDFNDHLRGIVEFRADLVQDQDAAMTAAVQMTAMW
jgi:hypothetical protein